MKDLPKKNCWFGITELTKSTFSPASFCELAQKFVAVTEKRLE